MVNTRGVSILLLLTLLMTISSCNIPASTTITAPTQTSITVPQPTATLIPTVAPTITPSPAPTETPPGPGLYLPVGFATALSTGSQVAYYDLQGQQLGELQTPGLGTGIYQQAHVAGPLTDPAANLPPLVFYAFQNGGELWLNDSQNLSLIRAAPSLFNIVGITGKSLLAYSLVEYTDAGVRSRLYIGDLQTLPGANTVLDNTNSQSYAVKPLAIALENGQPSGIWYTSVPYGIGGDIVFEPRQTLTYLSLSDYNLSTRLDMTLAPAGISDDQTWVAYTPTAGNGPMSIMHNFDPSSAITFPLRQDSNRGAGDAVFSPDNQYLAWREAGGSLMDLPPTFHEMIRIASVSGNILTEIPDTLLLAATGFSQIGSAIPIGWLDTQTLALEVRDNSSSSAILKVNLDGSGLTFLASGAFIGFLYP